MFKCFWTIFSLGAPVLLRLIFVLILSFFVFIIIYTIIVITYLVINLLMSNVDVYTEAVVILICIKQINWPEMFTSVGVPDRIWFQMQLYLPRTKSWVLGNFWKLILSKKNQCVLVSWMSYGRSSRYHSFKQKQGLFHSFNPHSTMARSHTTRNRDFLESISFSF